MDAGTVLRAGRVALKMMVLGALAWYAFWAVVLFFGWMVAWVFARALVG